MISDNIMDIGQGQQQEDFFEGTEKLLELWFESTRPGCKSLRLIPRFELDEICKLAECEIISEMHNESCDSYVLSESSLFVSDNRLILKTCGTTVPLNALDKIMICAKKYANQTELTNVFYSRKNFLRPSMQPEVHSSIDDECMHLDKYVKNGTAYCLGGLRDDRWYLYTCNPPRAYLSKADHTLEIIMQDLDREVMDTFTMEQSVDGYHATKLSGIDKLVPSNTKIDSKLFEPCGYSMNGLIGDTDEYVTIHVTPEPEYSYVSFETNQSQLCLFSQLVKVIATFRPNRFLLTVCADDGSDKGRLAQKDMMKAMLPGFKRVDFQMVITSEHAVMYARYERDQYIKEICK